jgi:CRP/FNR family transcriptional regulator, cyclic AMP receptor protein
VTRVSPYHHGVTTGGGREVLAAAELFRAFSPDGLDRVAAEARSRPVRRNELLFAESDPSEELFVVISGRIGIANRSLDGRESMVALMEPGDLFGDLPLFDGGHRSADARALEASVVYAIPYEAVRGELERDPTLLWSVVELLSLRIRADDAALADAMFLDVTGRTAKRLLELAGDADEFELPITQEELAGLAGASRERVNKALASFMKLGWISQSGRRYRITNREQLTRRAR